MSSSSKPKLGYGLQFFAMMLLLPLCVLYDIYWFLQIRLNHFLNRNKKERHEERVKKIQQDVREWITTGSKKPMCTARPNYKSITFQTLKYKERCHQIKIDLADVLSIDQENRIVSVEPMVTIGQLNNFLVQRGWTLPVVPEIDDLTIGGLVMGGGIESTSHKYGLFTYICKKFEMVLSDASKVTCSANEWPELFSAIPFSYGTLGFLTKVDIDIIPYKPFIKLKYIKVNSLPEAVKTFKAETFNPKTDSVEGILYSREKSVIMSGQFVDKVDDQSKFNPLGRWYKPWFFKHVETILEAGVKEVVEIIPTVDFYHRHDRSCFWLTENLIPFGNEPWFRYLFGWILPVKHSLVKFCKESFPGADVPMMKRFVCQDLGITIDQLEETLEMVDKETGIYPIWLCPTRHMIPEGLEHLAFFKKEDLHIDVGIYGFCEKSNYEKIECQKRIERFCLERQGFVALYAETQMDRKMFDDMFHFSLRNYEKLRKELKCENAFPHMFEKVISGRGKL